MKRYFLPSDPIKQTTLQTGANPLGIRKGYIALWDKNSMRWSYWKIVEACQFRYGWLVERRSCPSYWNRVIKEEARTPKAKDTV